MKLRPLNYIFIMLLVLLLSPTGSNLYAQIGIRLSFDKPATFLSSYIDEKDEFSAAIYPVSYPRLTHRMVLKNKVKSSTFSSNSMQFETEYYRYRRDVKYLTPISVDAHQYFEYSRERYFKESFQETSFKLITSEESKKKSAGLGLNVALPSRLKKIFGEGDAGLKVSGYQKISFSGRSTWTNNDRTDAFQPSRFPTLRIEQTQRFDITGTIGTKITVKVSQDSQTDIPLANRIQIRYKGDEDDIIKSIEAGNTTLQLPNKEFVGYSSQIRGLFGLKMEAQVGNLSLIGIASQEKGSTEKTSVTPTGQENAEYIRDYSYEMRRIFDLALPGELQPGDSIVDLKMFESDNPTKQNRGFVW